jgi:iron complex outermembrane receptor protein
VNFFNNNKLGQAIFLGAVSYVSLSLVGSQNVQAQASLPAVTVDAPNRQVVRPQASQRRAASTRGPVRRATAPLRQAAPIPYATPSTGVIGALPAPYAGGQVARGGQLGILGNRDVMNTPFNQVNITSKTIEDQQARTVADVVQNDPSVRSTWADGGYSNQFSIRGFPVGASEIALNGLYGVVPYQVAGTAFVERVEILKGPSAFLNGMAPLGGVGGTINLVPKRAQDDPLARLTLGYISKGQYATHIDASQRFGDNKEWGVRFNGAYNNGDTPLQNQTSELGQAALGVDYRGERIRVSADLNYQKIHADDPSRPVYFNSGFAIPRPPSNTASLGQPGYFADGKDIYGMVNAEADITDNTTVFASAGARRNDFLGVYSFLTLTDSLGNASGRQFVQPSTAESYSGQAGFRTKVDTGPVHHEFTFAATGLSSTIGGLNTLTNFTSNIYNVGPLPPVNLANFRTDAPRSNVTDLTSYSLSDTMSILNDRVQLTVGGRQQQIQISNYSTVNGALTSAYDQSALTPFVGIVVKPLQNISLYANYIEGLTSGGIAPVTATANAGQMLPPANTEQLETGIKIDFGRITTTLALFQITQPLAITQNNLYQLGGEQRNRGFEFNVFGEVYTGVRLLGGFTLLDGVLTKTLNNATNGFTAVGVPDVQVNLGAEWDNPFIHGLTHTGRVIYTSSQVANAANTQSIPDWTRTDVGARYTFLRENGKPVVVRANVENVFNENYWSAVSANFGLARGAPRTYLVSATFDF